jgi:hypothetical protein
MATVIADAAPALTDVTVPFDVTAAADAQCVAPGTEIDASIPEGAFACCAARVEVALGDAGFPALQGAAATDPEVLACCNAILARLVEDVRTGSPTTAADQTLTRGEEVACCEATGSFVGPACQGWGPPVPPAMVEPDGALQEVA